MYAGIKLCFGRSVLLQVRKFLSTIRGPFFFQTKKFESFRAVCREFGIQIGRLWLIFQLFSPGMFIASTAFLPSSFAMYFCSAALAAWWHQKYNLAVYFVAIAALLGKFYFKHHIQRPQKKFKVHNQVLNITLSR